MGSKFVGWSKKKHTRKQELVGSFIGAVVFLIVIPLIIILISISIDHILGLPKLVSEPFNIIFALPLIIIGLLLGWWSTSVLFKVGKGTPSPVMPTKGLITTGPYAFCRNPMFLGIIIYYFGVSLYFSSPCALILTLLSLLLGVIYIKAVEEKELRARFGGEYEEYKKSVPFLIPRLGRRRTCDK